jgi:hypothetical protein
MITDDDLLLFHYRDGLDAAERARIGAALVSEPQLAQRLQILVARLDAAAAQPEVPVPDAVKQRWQVALERAAQEGARSAGATQTRAPLTNRRWLAAAAAVAGVAILLTMQMTRTPDRVANEVIQPAPGGDATAYERGLKFHLASTEQTLAGIDSASPEERARLIETISAQNRMYALAAERAGEPQLARVLRAFAPILDSLARDDGDSSAALAQLGFELRVMQGRLGADAHAAAGSAPTTL